MPFYTFRTEDEGIKNKDFEVYLTFKEYDAVMAKESPLIHPDTEKPLKKWQRLVDNVNINFAQPEESSRWDNFEYRAAHNLMKAKEERRTAQEQSHMGETPYQKQEQQYADSGQVDLGGHSDLGEHDMAGFEGKVV